MNGRFAALAALIALLLTVSRELREWVAVVIGELTRRRQRSRAGRD